MIFITFAIGIIMIVVWYHIKYRRINILLSRLPTPKSYPVLRNSLEFINKTPQELFNYINDKRILGPVWLLTLHPFDKGTVITYDLKVVEEVLTSQKILDKGADYDLIKAWLGTGLLISTGKKWHQRRKVLTPSFHFQILEKFVEIMDKHGKVLIKKLEAFDGKEIDIFPLVNLYALDVICESAMGYKLNSQVIDSDYVKAVKKIANIIYERSFDPFRRFDFIYKFTEMYRNEKKCLKVLHDFTDNVIKARREVLMTEEKTDVNQDIGIKKKKALLDFLLQASIDGKPLTDQDIREEVDTFMFEGHDTTTSGISFCLYNIAKHPEVQQKVFDEIQEKIGSDKIALSTQKLSNLHYLELVIKETLRLYPSVPYFARRFTEETTIAGYTFPEGCNIYISPYTMGRDPKLFPDPLVFEPSRFDVETTFEKVNPFAYVPFSAGPRNCIGQKFAMFELKSIICKIVRNFELSISNDENVEVLSELVLKSTKGVLLHVKKRQ